jgi:tripartite-type tricarboxylate transporter receptor subunit TctC
MKRLMLEKRLIFSRIALLGTLLSELALLATPARADSVEDFYRGKTVDVFIGVNVGGGYDLEARLIAQFMGRHLPGHPTFVPQNMVGAGGISMANYLYSVAPKDGTSLGMFPNTLIALQAVGGAGVRYDANQFVWLGTLSTSPITLVAWHSVGVKDIADIRAKKITVAASAHGAITYTFPYLANVTLGTNLDIVTGYQGTSQMNLAMQRGEVDAVVNSWSSWKSIDPEWVEDKDIVVLLQGNPKAPDLPGVPSISELVTNPDDKALVDFVLGGDELDKPLGLTPGVPADRVNAMRAAYAATLADPDFLAAAAQARVEIAPVFGDRLQALVARILATPKRITDKAKAIIE